MTQQLTQRTVALQKITSCGTFFQTVVWIASLTTCYLFYNAAKNLLVMFGVMWKFQRKNDKNVLGASHWCIGASKRICSQ